MSTGPSIPEEKLAPVPFDDARADLILQSNDEVPVHFRVSKFILSIASPVFADMLSIPLPTSRKTHEIQVVALPEGSEMLDLSLRHLYPVRLPEVVELRQILMLAEFAHKYQVDALEQDITRYLMDAINRDPVGVYAIANKFGYKGIVEKAALSSLDLQISQLLSQHVQYAPAELGLLRYHVACGQAASAVVSQRTWFPVRIHNTAFMTHDMVDSCTVCNTWDFTPSPTYNLSGGRLSKNPQTSGPRCLWNYLHRSAVVLAHHPTADVVIAEDFVLKDYNCRGCPMGIRRGMLEFSRIFGAEIKKAIERVGGSLDPQPRNRHCPMM
ncbi:hypothetical protein BC827DRAFT_504209 [Russula dissimulans]|nr:hypothetical protein BC827DRAFT_504209 [Russula dissimulans]